MAQNDGISIYKKEYGASVDHSFQIGLPETIDFLSKGKEIIVIQNNWK